ncbi:MAG TPA: alpha/beta hydrolase [Bacteroidetes bacterium]|jgi:3-oxoadipate enol-lactonase|nr:alpha/beta hydrolase [Bacteroidota bacterium]
MFVNLHGDPFNYVEVGNPSGMPVVFVHGFPFSHVMWTPQLDVVGKHHRAIAYDVRGHGDSYVGTGQYTMEGHVDDLVALLDHLQIQKAVIVGLSMGGYIALRALERNPERFRAAVLCDTRSEADGNEGKLKRFTAINAIKRDGSAVFADGFVKIVFAPTTVQENPQIVEQIRSIISRTSDLSIAGTQLALATRTDTTASLAHIKIPTLILVGELDVTTPPSDSQSMHKLIAGSELHIVPHAAHVSNLENPGFFNERLLAFLSRVASMKS